MNPVLLRPVPHDTKPHGFTLLEVLITVVIVALGLLGLGALHVRAMRDTSSAYLRSEAIALTQDMADRIRANPLSANAYQMDLTQFNTNKAAAVTAAACLTNACSTAALAAADLAQWSIAVANRLPSGQGKIDITTTSGVSTWTITVYWDERRDGSTGTNCSGSSTDLACLRVRMQP